MCVRERGREKGREKKKDLAVPALVHDMWVDIEDVISITFTGLMKPPQSCVVFIHLRPIRATLSFVLHSQQLL